MKILITQIAACVLFSFTCLGQGQSNSEIAADLCEKGNSYLQQADDKDGFDLQRPLLLNALNNFNQALSYNSSSELILETRIRILCRLKQYQDAINAVGDMERVKGKTPESTTIKGYMLEGSGKQSEALVKYNEAISLYRQRIPTNKDSIADMANIALIHAFTQDEDTAQIEINEIVSKYPKNAKAKHVKYTLEHFDKQKLIEDPF